MKKKNTIISDWLNRYNNPEIDEQVKKQLEENTKWENLQFPIVKNIQAKSLADSIEGIPTEDMPGKMNEMYQSVFNHAVETINKELNEIRNIEGKEDRIKYLEELLAAWS